LKRLIADVTSNSRLASAVDWVDDLGRLRLIEAQFQTLFDVSANAILLTDVDTRVIRDANPAACRLFGYERLDLIGKRTADLVHPDSLDAYSVLAGRQHDRQALVGRRADGSAIDMEITARDLLD